MRRFPPVFFLFLAFLAVEMSPAWAGPTFIDLSKAANMGPAQSFDEEVADGRDLKEKEGFANIPQGPQTFRGIPFFMLEAAGNQGHSFVVLKGRRKGGFPEAVALNAGGIKAANLYFLHSCRWGGTSPNITVAEYDIIYDDGQVAVVPLKVGVELTNFSGSDDTGSSYLAWWHKYRNIDMGINLFPWKNPRPDVPIQTILFKSLDKTPVPILFAITASDKEIPVSSVSPKPERTFQTDTTGWIPFNPAAGSPVGTAIDMSFLLDAPAGKHGALKADGEKLVFEDGTPARFWGTRLAENGWNLTDGQLSRFADRLAAYGCNLLAVDGVPNAGVTGRLIALAQALKPKGIYLDLTCFDKTQIPEELAADPSVITQRDLWVFGKAYRNDLSESQSDSLEFQDNPMLLHPENSILAQLAFSHSVDFPYHVEWRDGWPGEYQAEAPLLMAAYGALEDWSACLGMELGGTDWEDSMGTDVDLNNKPALLIQWPAAALAFLRGDIKRGRYFDLEAGDEKPDLATVLKALAHCSGMNGNNPKFKTDAAGVLKAKIQPKLKSLVSDTGQVSWQGNVGLAEVSSPRFQAIVGFLGHRKMATPVWEVESPNFFASLSLVSLNKTNLWASDHMLLTGVARMENTGQVYNAAKTKLIFAGKAPILREPLQAKITIFRYKSDPKLEVRALDANGQTLKTKIRIKWAKNNLVFSWVPGAFYMEVFKK